MNVDLQLSGLYPHLAQPGLRAAEPAALQGGLLDAVRLKAGDSVAIKQRFFALEAPRIVLASRLLAASFRSGGRLYTMGNGGSSCDAAHLAVEFQHPVTAGRPALPAVNLSQDMAMITAVANDIGFAHVYTRQVLAHVGERDAVVAISTSGNSENLLAGLAAAKRRGATTLGLAGGDGGRMVTSTDVDLCLVVPTDSIHRVQETHVALYHILWDLTHTLLADDRAPDRASDRAKQGPAP
ncbi:MAG: D-sedoheptulose-7-phosphate isomerase [Rubrivivax sp.]